MVRKPLAIALTTKSISSTRSGWSPPSARNSGAIEFAGHATDAKASSRACRVFQKRGRLSCKVPWKSEVKCSSASDRSPIDFSKHQLPEISIFNQVRIGTHPLRVGTRQAAFGIVKYIAKKRTLFYQTGKFGKKLRLIDFLMLPNRHPPHTNQAGSSATGSN